MRKDMRFCCWILALTAVFVLLGIQTILGGGSTVPGAFSAADLQNVNDLFLAGTVAERRNLTFEREVNLGIPKFDRSWKDGFLRVKYYRNRYYELMHFPYTLMLWYERCQLTPGDTVQLVFKLIAENGDGKEFIRETGDQAKIRAAYWTPSFKSGEDYEYDMISPLENANYTVEQVVLDLFVWDKFCLFDLGIGPSTGHVIDGKRIDIPLTIFNPSDPNEVWFVESGNSTATLHFGPKQSADYGTYDTLNMAISLLPPYIGDIKLRAWANSGENKETQVGRQYGVGVGGFIELGCSDAWHWEGDLNWYALSTTATLSLDESESDNPEWDMASSVVPCLPGGKSTMQDLKVSAVRTLGLPFPIPGIPDELEATIENSHDSVCSPYNEITILYYLDLSDESFFPIGSSVLNDKDPRLVAFNTGTSTKIVDTFSFQPTNPFYPFTEDYTWPENDRFPRYRVEIAPIPDPPCPGWSVLSAMGIESGLANNRTLIAFSRPLPDFAIDSVKPTDTILPYIEFKSSVRDTFPFDVFVTNEGVGWPMFHAMQHPSDSIYIDCRVSYLRYISDTLVELHFDYLGQQLITPMAQFASDSFHFEYVVPAKSSIPYADSVDVVTIAFEVNGGGLPLSSRSWESSFVNNLSQYSFNGTNIVECGFPSGVLSSDFSSIQADLPDINLSVPPQCPRMRYLYLSDDDFSYTIPNTPPTGTRVDIGYGPPMTHPADSAAGWVWFPTVFQKDFIESTGSRYKVFSVDACVMAGAPGSYVYTFRASQDRLSEHPVYAYADRDGWCSDNSGGFTFTFTPSMFGVLNRGGSCCQGTVGNIDGDPADIVDIGDLTFLIDHLFINFAELECPDEANCDSDPSGIVDISDLTFLIDHLFISFPELNPCP